MIGLREKEKTVLLVKPSGLQCTAQGVKPEAVAAIEQICKESDFEVVDCKSVCLSEKDGKTYDVEEGGLVMVFLLKHMENDTVAKVLACEPLKTQPAYCSKTKWDVLS